MTQANELRIGNWVNFCVVNKGGKTISYRDVQVKEINEKNVLVSDLGQPLVMFYDSVAFQPIPLTPSILEKCGFIEDDWMYKIPINSKKMKLPYFSFRWISKDLVGTNIEQPFARMDSITDMYYLHELQNVFYALTQTELNYTP